jgi:hypothetical protein
VKVEKHHSWRIGFDAWFRGGDLTKRPAKPDKPFTTFHTFCVGQSDNPNSVIANGNTRRRRFKALDLAHDPDRRRSSPVSISETGRQPHSSLF